MRRATILCLLLLCSFLIAGRAPQAPQGQSLPIPEVTGDLPREDARALVTMVSRDAKRARAERPHRTVKRHAHPGQVGRASFYDAMFNGRSTANGETYSDRELTAAHRTLGFGTLVRVTNLDNLRSVIVRVNDRGPYVRGRIIDLSRRAARVLGFVETGVTRVKVEPLGHRTEPLG